MPLSVAVSFGALALAAVLHTVEVVVGRRQRAPAAEALLALVYGAASVAGAALLAALSGAEWVLALALVPLTALSVLRFWTLFAPSASARARTLAVGVVLVLGVLAALQVVPIPLTRVHLSGADAADAPPTVRPRAGRAVRV